MTDQYKVRNDTTSATVFLPGDLAVVLGDQAEWEHNVPPLHRVKILGPERPNNDYPEFEIQSPDGGPAWSDKGHLVEVVPCKDKCHSDGTTWDVALCDLEALYVPVTEEELEEVAQSLGVDKSTLA